MNFNEIKNRVSRDIGDDARVYFDEADVSLAVKEGYEDVVALSQCITKTLTLDFVANQVYYDFEALVESEGDGDFLAVVGIYNNSNNRFLFDDSTLRDFSKLRDDWELWVGTPQYWAAAAWNRTALIPHYSSVSSETFDLHYWAQAPTFINEDSPNFPTQFHRLIEHYATADLLETAEEFTKAQFAFEQYRTELPKMIRQTKAMARSNFLLRA